MATRMTSVRFVGRSAELAELIAAFRDAGERRASLALVGGESGVGKSRLAGELSRHARESGARILSGDCVELGEDELPYAPLVAALRPLHRTCEPVLAGGNVDRLFVVDSPLGAFEGLTLRLYSPDEGVWRIWWSSDRAPGVLDEPVVGRFTDGHGVFECVQQIRGADVLVRFEWITSGASPRWRQSFSWDAGSTWSLNWEMDFERRG